MENYRKVLGEFLKMFREKKIKDGENLTQPALSSKDTFSITDFFVMRELQTMTEKDRDCGKSTTLTANFAPSGNISTLLWWMSGSSISKTSESKWLEAITRKGKK